MAVDPAVIAARNRLNIAARWHKAKQSDTTARRLEQARREFELAKANRMFREATRLAINASAGKVSDE
jgi:hypothetical protein